MQAENAPSSYFLSAPSNGNTTDPAPSRRAPPCPPGRGLTAPAWGAAGVPPGSLGGAGPRPLWKSVGTRFRPVPGDRLAFAQRGGANQDSRFRVLGASLPSVTSGDRGLTLYSHLEVHGCLLETVTEVKDSASLTLV